MTHPRNLAQCRLAVQRGWLDPHRAQQLLAWAESRRAAFSAAGVHLRVLDPQQAQFLDAVTTSTPGDAPSHSSSGQHPTKADPRAPHRSPSTHDGRRSTTAEGGRASLPHVGGRLGDYVLERELGRGGMGAVFVARHPETQARYALKVQLVGAGDAATRRERFEREARALGKVGHHPGVVQIHHFGVFGEQGVAYCVLDLVEGGDLERAIQHAPLDPDRGLRIAQGIAEALAFVHAQGIVHRDLKPANVLLSADDDSPLLTDFGLVRSDDEERLTQSGQVLGTLSYMAPEQIAGEIRRITPKTDVFALGAVLYEAFTGKVAFEGDNVAALAARIVSEDVDLPSEVRPDLPGELDVVLQRALEKDPDDRPTASELAAAFAAVRAGQPLPWSRVGSWVRFAHRVRRRDPRAVALALVLGAGLTLFNAATITYLTWIAPRQRAQATWSAHQTWAADALEPFALGVDPDATTDLTDDDLAQRADALRQLQPHLDEVGQAEVARALDWLDATRRVLALQDGAELTPTGSGDPAAATADALILAAQGDLPAARDRLHQAAEGGFPPARRLRLRLLARAEPETFMARAEEWAGSELRQTARACGLDALCRYQAGWIAEAPRRSVEWVTERAALQRPAALALGVDADALQQSKRDVLDRTAEAWAQAWGDDGSLRVLDALAATVGAWPPTEIGPALREALWALRRSEALMDQSAFEHALEVDHRIVYGIDPRPAPRHEFARAVNVQTKLLGLEPVSPELLLAGLRYGVDEDADELVEHIEEEALARLSGTYPESQALALLRTLAQIASQGGLVADTAHALGEATRLPLDDLNWTYKIDALLLASHFWSQRLEQPRGEEFRRELERAAREAVALTETHETYMEHFAITDAYAIEQYLLRGAVDEIHALWERAARRLAERVARIEAGTMHGNLGWEKVQHGRTFYHRCLLALSHSAWPLLEDLARDGVRVIPLGAHERGDVMRYEMLAFWIRARDELGDPEGAWALIHEHERSSTPAESETYAETVARFALAQGDPDRAWDTVREALILDPDSRQLLTLRAELRETLGR